MDDFLCAENPTVQLGGSAGLGNLVGCREDNLWRQNHVQIRPWRKDLLWLVTPPRHA